MSWHRIARVVAQLRATPVVRVLRTASPRKRSAPWKRPQYTHQPGVGRVSLVGPLLRLRSDEQLIAVFRAGNDDAFGVIHDRYRQRLFAYVRQMLSAGPRQDAEDVLQDVFVRAFAALAGRPPRDQPARLALPRRPQPLHRPPAPPDPARPGDLRGLAQAAARPGRGGPAARASPPARRRRRPAARPAALGAAHARDGRHDLRRPGRRAGRHGARRQVAARAGTRGPGRGRRGARRRLQRRSATTCWAPTTGA